MKAENRYFLVKEYVLTFSEKSAKLKTYTTALQTVFEFRSTRIETCNLRLPNKKLGFLECEGASFRVEKLNIIIGLELKTMAEMGISNCTQCFFLYYLMLFLGKNGFKKSGFLE